MKILYVYCHPLPESFHAAIRAEALAGLKEAGHAVDLCDLYAEKFDPVMGADERREYLVSRPRDSRPNSGIPAARVARH